MHEQHRFHGGKGVTEVGGTRQVVTEPFRPRARVLQLLGDELIGSPRLAVFELVKNAYDADADEVIVRLDLGESGSPTITVTDDGEGMSVDVLRLVWLVPGTITGAGSGRAGAVLPAITGFRSARRGSDALPSTSSAAASRSPHGLSTATNASWRSTGTS